MELLSAGFVWSPPAGGPFWPGSFGDLEGASTDLIDGGCDERCEAVVSESPEDGMVGHGRAGLGDGGLATVKVASEAGHQLR